LRFIEGYGDDSQPVESLVDVFTYLETSGRVLGDTILKSLDIAGVDLNSTACQEGSLHLVPCTKTKSCRGVMFLHAV
jgi:hypothetical protein